MSIRLASNSARIRSSTNPLRALPNQQSQRAPTSLRNQSTSEPAPAVPSPIRKTPLATQKLITPTQETIPPWKKFIRPKPPAGLIVPLRRSKRMVGAVDAAVASGIEEKGPLGYDDGPMIWVDCEMTGLNPDQDCIIEIAVIITNGRLEPVDEGIEYVIQTPKEVLDNMNEWCINQHGKTGLTAACIDSPYTYEEVTKRVLEYIQRWVPERGAGLLAGSSVHADMRFLLKGMPEVMQHLSYRIVDVSSVKEICKRWYPSVRQKEQQSRTTESSHRALDDIRASIRELEFYQKTIFKRVEPVRTKASLDSSQPHKTALE